MKAFLAAIVAAALITVGANLLLNDAGFSARESLSGENVRLGPAEDG